MNVTHFRVIINQVHYIENSLLSIFTYVIEQYGITFNDSGNYVYREYVVIISCL